MKAGAKVTLIHVVEPMADSEDAALRSFTTRLSSEADNHLKERAQRFGADGIEVATENRVGKRHAEIVSFAMDQDVDLIILNAHKVTENTAPQSAFTLSHQVALMAPCAILMMKS